MSASQIAGQTKTHPGRSLILLGCAFLLAYGCIRIFSSSNTAFNHFFVLGWLSIPFIALRPLSQLPRLSKWIGFVLVTPLLLLCLVMCLITVTCDFYLHPYGKDSCLEELGKIEQNGYSVHLVHDRGCGGALDSGSLDVEQRKTIFPGLYLVRSIAYFDGAYEGQITQSGSSAIHVHVPKGAEGSIWHQEVDRTYMLKRYLYF
ncbi:MAG: hypothetical protein WB919_20420 [Candidatus Sulfotelmatobacter sp.]